ncbi:hypothetical protein C8Q74DRAFT_1209671 [Fomes fomentarius]|nr:hypothetical protein C8Q74DRAFT_1209671 [Fomes fomentarius]
MAEMARKYHNNVQKDDSDRKSPNEREADIVTVLNSLNASINVNQAAELGGEITYEECEDSLRFSKNGSAPGRDGIPFELWKVLHDRHREDSRHTDRADWYTFVAMAG